MFKNIPDQKLGIVGTAGAIVASIFLTPEKAMIPAACGVLAVAGSILFAQSRWVQS